MTKDLTTGNPMKLILAFALPTLCGMLFQQFYNLVDTMIVGKLLGAQALAAVGSTGSINFFVIGFCMGVCNGFAIPVAQRMGAREYGQMRRFVANAAYLSALFALVLTVATGLFCRNILVVMRTPADIIDNAYAYIFVIFMGIPATFLYNLLAAVIRSLGDSKTPVYFLALSSFLNIFLDFTLILYFKAGVAGAALATVTSQTVSGLACLVYMRKKYAILRTSKEERRLDGRSCRTLCMMGIPMGLQYSITAIGSIVLQSAVNTLGSTYVAAVAAGAKLFQLLACPYDAMGAAMATYCGQNVGAGKQTRAKQSMLTGIGIGLAFGCVVFVLVLFQGDLLAGIFSPDTEVVQKGFEYLKGFAPETIVTAILFSMMGYFNGNNQTLWVMVQSLIQALLVRLPLAYFMSIQPNASLTKIGLAAPVSTIVGIVPNIGFYLYWTRKQQNTFSATPTR